MSNFKKKYCLVSFIFAVIAVVAVVVTLVAFVPQKAYAASVNIPGVTDSSQLKMAMVQMEQHPLVIMDFLLILIMEREIYPEQFGFFWY